MTEELEKDLYDDYIDTLKIEDYDPKIWFEKLQKDLDKTRSKNREINRNLPNKEKRGQLDRILLDFRVYLIYYPIFFFFTSILFYFILFGYISKQFGSFAWLMTAIFAGCFTALLGMAVSTINWRSAHFEKNKARRRFAEMRERLWRSLSHRLKTKQIIYKTASVNEDPQVGPQGLMGARLLSRHAWEWWYLMRLDYILFRIEVKEELIEKTQFRIAYVCLGLVGLALGPVVFLAMQGQNIADLFSATPYYTTVIGPILAAIITFHIIFGHWRREILKLNELIGDLFNSKLSERAAKFIGLKEEKERYDWPERYEFDDLEEYLAWLKSQFEILKRLRDEKYPYATPPSDTAQDTSQGSAQAYIES